MFTVLFGESNTGEMTEVANLTGGRTFDARATGALPPRSRRSADTSNPLFKPRQW